MKKIIFLIILFGICISSSFTQVLVSINYENIEIDNVFYNDVKVINVVKVFSDTEITHKKYLQKDFLKTDYAVYAIAFGNVIGFSQRPNSEPFVYYEVDDECNLIPTTKDKYVKEDFPDISIRGESWDLAEYEPNKVAILCNKTVERYDISDPTSPKEIKTVFNLFKETLKTKDASILDSLFDYQLDPFYYENYDWDNTVLDMICQTKSPDYIVGSLKIIDKYFSVPIPAYGGAINPIYRLIENKDYASIKKLLEWKPSLAALNTSGGQFCDEDPIVDAVILDQIQIVKLMLPYIKNPNNVKCLSDKQVAAGGAYSNICNLLSFACSEEMKKLLVNAGVEKYIKYDRNFEKFSYVTDYRVNIRESAGLGAKKIDQVNYGEKVEIIGIDPYYYKIDNYKGHWIHIRYAGNKEGYIFEKYIYQYFQ